MNFLGGCLTITAIILAIVSVFTLPVMWLWNWLMPYIFGLPQLGFFQTFGLLLLVSLLFNLFKPNTK
jgi:hypothetical protein